MTTRIDIKNIPFYLVWIMGLLELITVPLVVCAPAITGTTMKNPFVGALIGFAGILLLIICINRVLPHLHLQVMNGTLSRVGMVVPAVWSGLILCLIFVCQKVITPIVHMGFPFREMLIGGFSAGGAVFVTILLYRLLTLFLPFLGLKLGIDGDIIIIEKLSIWRWTAIAALYEAVALPVIWIWKIFPQGHPWWSLWSGFAGGFAGGFVVYAISHGSAISVGWLTIRRTKKPISTRLF